MLTTEPGGVTGPAPWVPVHQGDVGHACMTLQKEYVFLSVCFATPFSYQKIGTHDLIREVPQEGDNFERGKEIS